MSVTIRSTINMNPLSAIGTTRDQVAIDALEPIAAASLRLSRDDLFELLRDAKLDPAFWEELSAADALKMDYKHFTTQLLPACGIGVASVLQPLERFVCKGDLKEVAMDRLQTLNALVIMTFVHHPAPTREILILSSSRNYIDRISAFLCRDDNVRFMLRPWTEVDMEPLLAPALYHAAFHQGVVTSSRKQVAPELQLFENSIS